MQSLSSLLPHAPLLLPFLLTFFMFGGRYMLIAGILFAVAKAEVGRLAYAKNATPSRGQIMREIGYSLRSILIFGCISGVLSGYGLVAHSRIYWDIDTYGWLWFFLSIPLALLVHDAWFYWLHRLLHTRPLFRYTHALHHRSVYPSAWAVYSFHPSEAILEALIAFSVFFIVPMHPIAIFILQLVSTSSNAYGHCGRELLPPTWKNHWLGRWLNTASSHSVHHTGARGNYGLYFLFWDRLMGTLVTKP